MCELFLFNLNTFRMAEHPEIFVKRTVIDRKYPCRMRCHDPGHKIERRSTGQSIRFGSAGKTVFLYSDNTEFFKNIKKVLKIYHFQHQIAFLDGLEPPATCSVIFRRFLQTCHVCQTI